MENKIIGFLGVDKYDIILYLSRILYKLNKKILLLDCSENRALTYSIPMPNHILCEGDDSYIVNYRGIDCASNSVITQEIMEKYKQEYHVILMDFGFQENHELVENCTHIVLVLDQKLHNLKRIRQFSLPKECEKFLIFYEVYGCKISLNYIIEELVFDIPEDNIYEVFQDSVDIKRSIDCQYNDVIRFHKLTKPYQKLLHSIVATLYPENKTKEKAKAFLRAKYGR